MRSLGLLAGLMAASLSVAAAVPESNKQFIDPLDVGSEAIGPAAHEPIMATAAAGTRLIGVGMRGVIIASDDAGATWQYQTSPVQSDLTAVVFPRPALGWAVGHDGVILHSTDAGKTWQKQLDGRIAAKQFADYYDQRPANDPDKDRMIKEVGLNYQAGPSLPWLDVWFEDSEHGYAVGSFGMLAATSDGGKSWQPWLERIDNPQALNLNSIRGIDGEIYIAGERGMVYRLDRRKQRFNAVNTGYAGSFFGITGDAEQLVAFGLRGTVYRSTDHGEHWILSTTPMPVTVTAGATLGSDAVLLLTLAGSAWSGASAQDAGHFVPLDVGTPDAFTSLTPLDERRLLISGLGGVQLGRLP